MKDPRRGLLSLLSAELFGQNDKMDFSEEDLTEIYRLAKTHAVSPLIYSRVKQTKNAPESILKEERAKAVAVVLRNEKMMQEQTRILAMFSAAGIPCAILKGSSAAVCYPHPEMRKLGDIDILLDSRQIPAAEKLLEADGYVWKHEYDFHSVYSCRDVVVELHNEVSTFPDTQEGNYAKEYMSGALRHTHTERMQEWEFPALDSCYQLVALLAHMEHHMIATSIGLRQLCDWAVTVHHYREQITDEVLQMMERCGLLRFAKVLTQLCTMYLGLPEVGWCKGIDKAHVNMMYEEILFGGNIRTSSVEKALSSVFIDRSARSAPNFLKTYISKMNGQAKREHPFLEKAPFLLPVFWVYYPVRWKIRVLFGKRKNVGVAATLQLANRRKRLYDWLNLFKH